MSLLSNKLRKWADPATGQECLVYWCQGCKMTHSIRTQGQGACWYWNGDVDKPVFGPSVLATSGHYVPSHKPGDTCWCDYAREHPEEKDGTFGCVRCHTFVGCNGAQPGEVIFLGDCTHELAGQVLPLPDLPEYMRVAHD